MKTPPDVSWISAKLTDMCVPYLKVGTHSGKVGGRPPVVPRSTWSAESLATTERTTMTILITGATASSAASSSTRSSRAAPSPPTSSRAPATRRSSRTSPSAASAPSSSTTAAPTHRRRSRGRRHRAARLGLGARPRLAGHRNVIDAAKAAGVAKLVYTSAPKATTADFALAPEHKATEEAIAASGIPAVILRNNWYTENYAADVTRAAETGVIAASVGDGRVATATRADYADAAAVVLLEDGHLGEIYELGGDIAWDYAELAAAASEVVGSPGGVRVADDRRARGGARVGRTRRRDRRLRRRARRRHPSRRARGPDRHPVAPHRPADDAARGRAARGCAGAGAVGGLIRRWSLRLRTQWRSSEVAKWRCSGGDSERRSSASAAMKPFADRGSRLAARTSRLAHRVRVIAVAVRHRGCRIRCRSTEVPKYRRSWQGRPPALPRGKVSNASCGVARMPRPARSPSARAAASAQPSLDHEARSVALDVDDLAQRVPDATRSRRPPSPGRCPCTPPGSRR